MINARTQEILEIIMSNPKGTKKQFHECFDIGVIEIFNCMVVAREDNNLCALLDTIFYYEGGGQ